MCIGKQGPTGSELVHMGRLYLGMAFEWSYPIIQVINGDKKDIGLADRFLLLAGIQEKETETDEEKKEFFHADG